MLRLPTSLFAFALLSERRALAAGDDPAPIVRAMVARQWAALAAKTKGKSHEHEPSVYLDQRTI